MRSAAKFQEILGGKSTSVVEAVGSLPVVVEVVPISARRSLRALLSCSKQCHLRVLGMLAPLEAVELRLVPSRDHRWPVCPSGPGSFKDIRGTTRVRVLQDRVEGSLRLVN